MVAGPEKVEILRIATRQVSLVEYCQASEVLQRGSVLSRLNAEQQRVLLDGGKAAAFTAGQEILELGQGAKSPALVLSGSVSLQSGPLCEVALVGAGDIFGLESLYPACPRLGARAGKTGLVGSAGGGAFAAARVLAGRVFCATGEKLAGTGAAKL